MNPDKRPKSFSDMLSALMQARGLGVRELARQAKVGAGSINDWKSGKHKPRDYQAVGRLADALGVSMSYLLRGKEDRVAVSRAELGSPPPFVDGDVIFDGYANIHLVEGQARIRISRIQTQTGSAASTEAPEGPIRTTAQS